VGGRTDAVSGALKGFGLAGREGRDGGNRTRERNETSFWFFAEWKFLTTNEKPKPDRF
jgi:hypothetical protein